jgi:hypothetical protein
MSEFLAILIGIVGGFVNTGIRSLLVSRRDQYRNSNFMITVWKIGWWIVGFFVSAGLSYEYLLK